MRADLSDHASTIVFIWGQGSYVPDGFVHVKHRAFTDKNETFTLTLIEARNYWAHLVDRGYGPTDAT